MAQTAVEYLMNHFRILHIWQDGEPDEMLEEFNKAKQMEKEQIIEAWMDIDTAFERKCAEQYYKETYGKE